MQGNISFAEKVNLVAGILPQDLNGGAQNGDWVSLKNYLRCAVIFFADNGTAGSDVTLTFQQATDVSGTGAKALTVTDIWHKQGTLLSAVSAYTHATQTAAGTYTNTDSGENENIYVIDIPADSLDVANSFDCIRCNTNAPGAAKTGCVLYALHDPKYSCDPLLESIAD